jgi:kynureninase
VVTPREGHRRGGHVSLAHDEAVRVCRALKRSGIVPDFRPPNLIRLAPVALYNTFEDCYRCVERLRTIVNEREYEAHAAERELVA